MLSEFKSESLRGKAGFFRVGRGQDGTWWLIDPEDVPFFACGVAVASTKPDAAGALLRQDWSINLVQRDGPLPVETGDDAFTLVSVGFRQALPEATIRLQGVVLPDVFDSRWKKACRERAEQVCAPLRENRRVMGYGTDLALHWAQTTAFPVSPPRPSLLQVCLSLEPGFAAYHASWEFILAAYGGELAAAAQAWEIELSNREGIRQLTKSDAVLQTPGFVRDNERFSREFARIYFSTTAAVIREADPNHLVVSAGFARAGDAAALAESAGPETDILLVDFGRSLDRELLDQCSRAGALPLLVGDYSWVRADAAGESVAETAEAPTPLEAMLARGRAELTAVIGHPAVVGYVWSRWRDLPEDHPPFGQGLVRVDGSPAREHADLIARINAAAADLHRRPTS